MAQAQAFPLHQPTGDLEGLPPRHALRPLWLRVLASLRAPDPGIKPADLHVPSRVWRRNSALLMSLYDRSHS